VIYTALSLIFLLACVAIGAVAGVRGRPTSAWAAAGLAGAMVIAQFAVLSR